MSEAKEICKLSGCDGVEEQIVATLLGRIGHLLGFRFPRSVHHGRNLLIILIDMHTICVLARDVLVSIYDRIL